MTYRTNGDYSSFSHGMWELSTACIYAADCNLFWTKDGIVDYAKANDAGYRKAWWNIQASNQILHDLADYSNCYVNGEPKKNTRLTLD